MDEYSGKKGSDGMFLSRKGSNLLRDSAGNRDQNAQFCNRIGCNGRLNAAKSTRTNFQDKAKFSKASLRSSSNGKELIGSSSRTSSVPANPRKSLPGPRKKLSSQPERDPSETSSLTDVPEVMEVVEPPAEKIQKGVCCESDNAGTRENQSTEVGSSTVPNTRSQRSFNRKSVIGKPDFPAGSAISLAAKNTTQQTRAGVGGYGLRNLRCSSVTDGIPTESSSSDSRQKGTVKRRISEGESSTSARGKKIGGLQFEGRNSSSGVDISTSDTRKTRSGTSNPNLDTSPASVRTRRPFSYTRPRVSNRVSGIGLSETSEPVISPPSSRSRSYGLPGNRNERLQSIRPSSPAEVGSIRSSIGPENFRRYNMDGIAEVLLALERIEQDEELTYEQLLVLETGLFLNGLNFYDQHRDMRLDIDDMSYEELLALEERMGSVSTALTEEALSECVKSSIYDSTSLKDTSSDLCKENDDVKCSVCQEEYRDGDEIGRLQCEHRYHLACIYQWLRLKNWCPICKAAAAASSSSISPPTLPVDE